MKGMKRRSFLITALVILFLVFSASGYFFVQANHREKSLLSAKVAPRVQVIVAKISELPTTVIAYGTVLSPENVILKAQQAGQIQSVQIQQGQTVQKGMLLLTLENSSELAEKNKAQAVYDDAFRNYQRYENLFKKQVVSEAEYDQFKQAMKQAQASLEGANASFEKTMVRAPFNGRVSALQWVSNDAHQPTGNPESLSPLSAGSYVDLGDPLIGLINLENLEVSYTLSGEFFTTAALGQAVILTTDAYPKQELHGTVNYIAPMVNTLTNTFTVYAQLDQNTPPLKPGLLMQVKQILGTRPVLALPLLSVGNDLGGYYVYLIANKTLQKKVVTLGIQSEDQIEISSGLKPGDQVVSSNLEALQPNQVIEIAP